MITVNSYFSGAGLMDIGLLNAGIKINQAFELDRDATETYRHNLGAHIKQCDVSSELVLDQDICDAMVFTYPCTKYSTIADIHGVRTGDDLFLHALRLLPDATGQKINRKITKIELFQLFLKHSIIQPAE